MPNQIRDIHSVDEESFPYILEQNVTVPLKSSEGLVRVNVYRPRTQAPVPVLATYGPYGKDIPYQEYVRIFCKIEFILMISPVSIPSHSQRSIHIRSLNTALGRRLIPSTGPSKDMPL
ncbi:hypothetical protein KC353_g22714 [Hortaea werneckii]|nr:hypothetical protein KC353_g22714 [Hortaea werneckii]